LRDRNTQWKVHPPGNFIEVLNTVQVEDHIREAIIIGVRRLLTLYRRNDSRSATGLTKTVRVQAIDLGNLLGIHQDYFEKILGVDSTDRVI